MSGARGSIENVSDAASEKQQLELQNEKASRPTEISNTVSWDGPDDPENPKNWAFRKEVDCYGHRVVLHLHIPGFIIVIAARVEVLMLVRGC